MKINKRFKSNKWSLYHPFFCRNSLTRGLQFGCQNFVFQPPEALHCILTDVKENNDIFRVTPFSVSFLRKIDEKILSFKF